MRNIDSNKVTGIIIIEDNELARTGWEIVLDEVSDFAVLGTFAACEDAFDSPFLRDADVILMDIGLPGLSGIDGIHYLKSRYSKIAVIVCTVHDDDDKVFDAIRAGADGYLLKQFPPEELIRSIKMVTSGEAPITPKIASKIITYFHANHPPTSLTPKEQEVLQLLAGGKTYKEIADELFISIDGVGYYIRHIYQKLQVHSRAEAVAKGLKLGLVSITRG